ncbi:uncharacterized protein LOC143301485 [Babylonia areolata]|uniref:uncharacterized protein LOC143301485 n=1 Tax=Babylonia areolata TaxID=304850 RepID=UPI003FD2285C
MHKTLLVLLLLSAVFVATSDARWFRKFVDKVKKVVTKVRDFVRKHHPLIRVLGKRSADNPPGTDGAEGLGDGTEEMSCETLGFTAGMSLDEEAEQDIFEMADGDGDGCLSPEEAREYGEIIAIFAECTMPAKKK